MANGTRTKAQQERLARYHKLGREQLHAAQSVFALDAGPRLTLLRDAATCFIAAFLVDVDEGADVDAFDAAAAWEHLEARVATGALDPPPIVLVARRWLVDSRPLQAPGPGEATDALAAAFAAVRWLSKLVDPRARWHARTSRTAGYVVLLVAIGASLAGLAAFALVPTNLAYGKAVTSSSRPDKSNRRPAGLTNGRLERSFGAETEDEQGAWFVLDLGEAEAIDRVVVFDRRDHGGDGNVPLVMEVGDSVDTLSLVATRTTPLSSKDPWVVDGLHRNARYVRLRRMGHAALVLDEVEVYR